MNCGLKLVVRDAPGMCVNVSVQSDLLKHWQKVIKADYNLILVQPGTLPQVWLIEHSLFSRTSKKCLALVAATGVKLSRHVDCICTPPPHILQPGEAWNNNPAQKFRATHVSHSLEVSDNTQSLQRRDNEQWICVCTRSANPSRIHTG